MDDSFKVELMDQMHLIAKGGIREGLRAAGYGPLPDDPDTWVPIYKRPSQIKISEVYLQAVTPDDV